MPLTKSGDTNAMGVPIQDTHDYRGLLHVYLICLAANRENRSHMKSREQIAQYKKPLQVINWKTLASSFQCVLDGSRINNHDTKQNITITFINLEEA